MAENAVSMYELLCSNGVHHSHIKVSPKQLCVIEERLADHYCLKIKTFCIIEVGV